MKKFTTILISLLFTFGFISFLHAQPQKTGYSMGTAGANSSGMFGVRSVGWNPANLGLKNNPSFSFYLPVSFATGFGNNVFSPTFISDNFKKGEKLEQEQKNDIIDKLDADDLKFNMFLGLPALGVSIKSYAFNIDIHSYGYAKLPADIFEMAMTGPVTNTAYDLSNVEMEALAYSSASLSAAKPLKPPHPILSEFSVGATFKYLYGAAYSSLDKHVGYLEIVLDTLTVKGKYDAHGEYQVLNSLRGDGVGLDLAAAGRFEPYDIYGGVTFGNLVGVINWTDAEIQSIQFESKESVDIDSLTDDEYWKNFFSDTDTTYDAGDFSTALPKYMLLSAEKSFLREKVDLFFSWYQGLNDSPAHNKTPKISLGTELKYLTGVPLRFGLGLGGIEKYEFAFGFGVRTPFWQMDIGMSWYRGMFEGAHGFSIGMSNYFGGI